MRKKDKGRRNGRPSLTPDSRIHAAKIESVTVDGVTVPQENAWATLLGVVRTKEGDLLAFPHPHIPGFYLTEAKRMRDKGRKELVHSLKHTKPGGQMGGRQITTQKTAVDAIRNLAVAVLLAAAGLEAIANECISRLEDDVTVRVERGKEMVEAPKSKMERTLSVGEKFDLVVPLVSQRPSIKGTAAWESLRRLSHMRNEIVHVKKRGQSQDPEQPSVFGQIVLGQTLECIDDAVNVVEAAFPDVIMDVAREELGMANAAEK